MQLAKPCKTLVLLLFLALGASLAFNPIGPRQEDPPPLDPNGGPCRPLAVGVPGEWRSSDGNDGEGFIHLLPSNNTDGVTGGGSTIWHQDTSYVVPAWEAEDQREASDRFGEVLAWGDFNDDLNPDLAVGVPLEDVVYNSVNQGDAGAVQVFYGSNSGFTGQPDQFFTQASDDISGVPESPDMFGAALAVGDFNGDGYKDLAVGSPGEAVGSISRTGMVHVLFGSAGGLSGAGSIVIHQDMSGDPLTQQTNQANDRFGEALAAGDFNRDGLDDLAIGEPGATVDGKAGAGAVTIVWGDANGLLLTGSTFLTQHVVSGDASEADDEFGAQLAVLDLNGDGNLQLAVSSPREDGAVYSQMGMVQVIGFNAEGASAEAIFLYHHHICGGVESQDNFGSQLETGDFNGDGLDDLAIGSLESLEWSVNAGDVAVIYGVSGGLLPSACIKPSSFYTADVAGRSDERFGSSLAAGNFNCDDYDDLAIGARGRYTNDLQGAGAVYVLSGAATGLQTAGFQAITQDSPSVFDSPETKDNFGYALDSPRGTNSPPDAPYDPVPPSGAHINVNIGMLWHGSDPDHDPLTYRVLFEKDDSTPDVVAADNLASAHYTPPTLEYNTSYYLQVIAKDRHNASATGPVWHFTTFDAPNQAPNAPAGPSPANGAVNQPVLTILSWTGGDPDGDDVIYDVFFEAGDATPDVAISSNQTGLSFTLPRLLYYTKYCWQIVATDEHDATKAGPVWCFTTLRGLFLPYAHK